MRANQKVISILSNLRHAKMTIAFALASDLAVSKPSPEFAPVTTTTYITNSKVSDISAQFYSNVIHTFPGAVSVISTWLEYRYFSPQLNTIS